MTSGTEAAIQDLACDLTQVLSQQAAVSPLPDWEWASSEELAGWLAARAEP